MNLPSDFNPFEHLQDLIIKVQNKIVKDEFNDLGDDTWTPNITTPRASLRVGCTLKDEDSGTMTLLRLFFFYFILRKAQDLQLPVYGIPITSFQEQRRFKPQIHLYFLETLTDVETGYSPVAGEITFRLMTETETSLTEIKLKSYAQKIKSLFCNPAFKWKKGKNMYTYSDWEKGYQFQLLCWDKTQAKKIIEQVLDIQSHTPSWKFLNESQNEEPVTSFPTIPSQKVILGKTRKSPRRRPVATVVFQYAVCHIHGLPNPVCLVDRTNTYPKPIEIA
jgi:hypothetical protein